MKVQQGSEESLEALGFTLPYPLCILEAGLFSTLLLRFLKLMLDGLLHQLESAVIAILLPVLLGVQELCPGLISQPVVLYLLECLVEPFDSSWGFGWLVLDEVELAWICSQYAALPFFHMPPAFAGTKGWCCVVKLDARPCGAHGCCWSRYCSVTETQSARPLALWLSYKRRSSTWVT